MTYENDEKTTELPVPTNNIVRVDFASPKKSRISDDRGPVIQRTPYASAELAAQNRAVTRWLVRLLALASIALLSLLMM